MWRVRYGDHVIYDPRDESLALLDMKGETALNETGSFEFSMPTTHPMAGQIACLQKDSEITVEQDGDPVFVGRAMYTDEGFYGSAKYTCEGDRGYLNDVCLPAYSTDEQSVPNTVDGLFNWYIAQYNSRVLPKHRFTVGINEGGQLDANNYISRSNSDNAKVWTEIKEKLLEKLGGFIRTRHEGGIRYIDYLSDGGKACAQRIEFGVNLLDYARATDSTSFYTVVIPKGADDEETGEPVTIESLDDGPLQDGYEKIGDRIVSIAGVQKYGVIEEVLKLDDATTPEYLLRAGLRNLVNVKVGDTLEISAVDLHQIDPGIDRIELGSYIRATSKPHGLDEYFLCVRYPFEPGKPGSSTYTLGSTYDTLTGKQSSRIASLNASINGAYDAMAPISAEAKAAAQIAGAAVTDSHDEYALSDSNSDPPTDGWGSETPAWEQGRYIWRRVVTVKGDGSTEVGAPALMTGNSGRDAATCRLDATNGFVFKNSEVETVMEPVVFNGPVRITDITALRSAFGNAAYIEWQWKRMGDEGWQTVVSTDSRISEDGFKFTLTPADVDTKVVFRCIVDDGN